MQRMFASKWITCILGITSLKSCRYGCFARSFYFVHNIGIVAKILQNVNFRLVLAIRVCRRETRIERTEDEKARSSLVKSYVKSSAPGHGIVTAVDVDCDGYFFATIMIDNSIKIPQPFPFICMVARQSGGKQRHQNVRPAGAVEFAPRFKRPQKLSKSYYLDRST